MNPTDPLDNLGCGDTMSGEIPPAPEDYEFTYPLLDRRSEEDLGAFGMNMVDDHRDPKHELRDVAANGRRSTASGSVL